jgi:DNA-binding transcriptional LysR family regulator
VDEFGQLPSYTLRQLHYFVAVADAGTIRAAAERLHVAESAISVAITDLERSLKVQLCVRRRAHGVTLTSSGRAVVRRARVLLHHARELETETGGGSVSAGRLAVGCHPVLGSLTLPRLLSGFNDQHPGVAINAHEQGQDELYRRLVNGELDLAIMYDVDVPSGLRRLELDRHLLHVILAADHQLADKKLDMQALASEPMVLLDLPPNACHALRICREAGIRPTVQYRTGGYGIAHALVGRGLGWTLLPARPERDVSTGLPVVALQLDRPIEKLRVVLAWPDDAGLSRPARDFVRYAGAWSARRPISLIRP